MTREERLNLIQEIIITNRLSKQKNLLEELEKHGVVVTQATLSRDMRELQVIKKRENGESFYAIMSSSYQLLNPDLTKSFELFVNKASRVQFMLVLQTKLGEADLLANAIDAKKRADILGTLAGADTLFVTCASEEAAEILEKEIANAIL